MIHSDIWWLIYRNLVNVLITKIIDAKTGMRMPGGPAL